MTTALTIHFWKARNRMAMGITLITVAAVTRWYSMKYWLLKALSLR